MAEKNNTTPIEDLSTEDIFEEIIQYLKTLKSEYFKYNPREPREDAILRIFEDTTDEHLKNKLRKAMYLCLEREKLLRNDPKLILQLLNLVDEMRVTQAKNILLKLANMKEFPGISPLSTKQLKRKIFSILRKFDIPEKDLKDIVDNNITDPLYTEICLIASAQLHPKVGSFKDNLPIAVKVYKSNPKKVRLSSVFRTFLHKVGEDVWNLLGGSVFLSSGSELKTITGVFSDAGLNPNFSPVGDEETYEILIEWPYRHRKTVSTTLYGISDSQRKSLKDYWEENPEIFFIESDKLDEIIGESMEDTTVPEEGTWSWECERE